MTTSDLHALAKQAGIEPEYDDAWGQRRSVSEATLRALLHALECAQSGKSGMAVSWKEFPVDTDSADSATPNPERAWCPPTLRDGGRRWGLAVQLYAVRSSRNWGIGDFTDLANLVRGAARLGAAAVGINPLHALFPEHPEHASPYSPSSRLFANPLYLDVEAIAELETCPAAQARIASRDFQQKLHAARTSELVDYPQVAKLKQTVFVELYAAFREQCLSGKHPRGSAFRTFQADRGDALHRFATFHAIAAARHEDDWHAWPAPLHDPDSPAVTGFAQAHLQAIEFHEYLQWQVALQLATLDTVVRDCGMSIGVYTDLAVGAAATGAEVWGAQQLWMHDVSIGAPPDALNLSGQNWGLPPMRPRVLSGNACADYHALLNATMQPSGALRIDHVLGLMRLWWIPQGHAATDGAYVRYPWQQLLDVVAGASRRHHCLVIGEDLGTVPHGLRRAMHASGVLSCRLLYFSKHDTGFPEPDAFPSDALIATGTHDLPPFGMWWRQEDIAIRDELELWPTEDLRRASIEDREQTRQALLDALHAQGLLASDAPVERPPFEAAHAYLARTPCKLLMVQLADVMDQRTQYNVPGTTDAYPNWRQKLPTPFEAALVSERMTTLAATLRQAGRADKPAT